MKIAIVGPSPVPFTIGGVENLLWGLCETINQNTHHQAELIKLPSKEHDFWSLIETYYTYYNLDLNHFDLIISTKYPSWMVRHPNSVCYMVHALRGLYDTYHFNKLPLNVKGGNLKIDKLLNYMEKNPNPNNLDEFFSMIFSLRDQGSTIPKEYFEFPAPFIRALIHYMDRFGLSQTGVRKFYSISDTVKQRVDYFPKNSVVEVVYPPSKLNQFKTGDYRYIFTVSRLDSPKRIDMMINAMKYVDINVKLLIAGTGPQESILRELAKGDDRIEFLGFINDDQVEDYYANSLVIPFFPYDEDYGLVTIEAMMRKKPVLTTIDAGGPTEFVINGETGYAVNFDPKEIGEKLNYFALNPDEARRMGENGYNKVKEITWVNTINKLLHQEKEIHSTQIPKKIDGNARRKKITVASTFPIYPPQGGGQARIYNLYKNIAKQYDVEIVSFTNVDQKAFDGFIASNLREIRIPKSTKHQSKEYEIECNVGIPISDIGMITLSEYTPDYGEELKKSIATSDIVVISHPYMYEAFKKCGSNKKFIYEAHNVESVMKKNMLPDTKAARGLVQQVLDTEKECCDKSEFIMTCSYEDQVTINKIYGTPMKQMIVVPNGVDCEETSYTTAEQRLKNKVDLGLSNEKMGLFMGSWHKPNLEACEEIFTIAARCPETKFLLMGSQCLYFEREKKIMPSNVGLLGLVSDEVKNRVFATVDFALNPMMSGSGTNLKMFDYMAAGIPIITTEFGTRGIEDKSMFIVKSISDMPDAIKDFNLADFSEKIESAREYVKSSFDWGAISDVLLRSLDTR
jgi:glycosyltransferase involved in cell wall biosynthesis